MSRTTNPELAQQIVTAARRLWRERGEKSLTLRAVARAAGTTPPSVYQRFPAKQDLIAALAERVRADMAEEIIQTRTLERGFRRYFEIAEQRRQEYGLIFGAAFPQLFAKGSPRPSSEWARRLLAERHGGRPQDYRRTVNAMICLLHGAASLLQYTPPGPLADEMRDGALSACAELADHPLELRKKRKQKRR